MDAANGHGVPASEHPSPLRAEFTMKPLIPAFPVVKFHLTDEFAVHGFGILVALGFIFGSRMAMRKAARDGLDPEVINRIVTWMVAGVFIGGHVGHMVMYYPQDLIEDPMSIFRLWEGLSSFGGFIGCTILAMVFFRKEDQAVVQANRTAKAAGQALQPRIQILGYADAMLFGFTLGWFLGRMGCFVAHDHPGVETDFFLGVYGMCEAAGGGRVLAAGAACDSLFGCIEKFRFLLSTPYDGSFGKACHDLGLYEAIWSLAMIPIFVYLDKKPRFPGFYTATWLLSYGLIRVVMDFFRTADKRYFGATPAQIGCLVMLAGGAAIIYFNWKKKPLMEANADHWKAQEAKLAAAAEASSAGDDASDETETSEETSAEA
jgi:phosphatidylglycerol:prolipoprotein diacylglycerol transferase